ncbi:hypothetical protein HYQ46_009562 [Verticillium longisporum]|nr:hypothetical protein HYQ46_009562 [Verticillium longisporum]
MTAPLVEPRYFILPWVFWRLLVPAWRAHEHTVAGEKPVHRVLGLDWFFAWGRRVDLRVVVETLWFVAINVVTMAIFLLKPGSCGEEVWFNKERERETHTLFIGR